MKTQPLRNDTLNRLLQNELEAVESYEMALAQLAGEPQTEELRRFELEHRAAAQWLENRVVRAGVEPSGRHVPIARTPISTAWFLLAALVGGALMFLLTILTGDFFILGVLFTTLFIALGVLHYLVWGRNVAPTK